MKYSILDNNSRIITSKTKEKLKGSRTKESLYQFK